LERSIEGEQVLLEQRLFRALVTALAEPDPELVNADTALRTGVRQPDMAVSEFMLPRNVLQAWLMPSGMSGLPSLERV
jgi:hypothetical protein